MAWREFSTPDGGRVYVEMADVAAVLSELAMDGKGTRRTVIYLRAGGCFTVTDAYEDVIGMGESDESR